MSVRSERAAVRATVFAACVVASGARASAADHEVYGLVGGGYFGGIERVLVGFGGGAGYRIHPTRSWAFGVEGRWLWYGGNAFTGALSAVYAPRNTRTWSPAFGLVALAGAGDQLRVFSSASPDVPSPWTVWAMVRLAPLRFANADFSVTVLGIDASTGLDAPGRSIAVALSVLEVGAFIR